MKWTLTVAAFLGALVLLCLPWGQSRGGAVNVLGSTSIQPFAEILAEEYHRNHPRQVVDVQGGGSTAGLQATLNGVVDIGMCSRGLKDDEKPLFQATVIARDGLAIVVHPSNPIEGLTRDQIRRMFAGQITNWRDVGGDDRAVRLITREEGSGTREAFDKLVMGASHIAPEALTQESNGAVQELVRHDRCAIGYMSLGLVGSDLRALRVDGRPATREQVKSKTQPYPLVRPFLFVTKGPPNDRARRFIDFVLSAHSQQILGREGLVEPP
jgi:phosphate transport system substrate-binding protein